MELKINRSKQYRIGDEFINDIDQVGIIIDIIIYRGGLLCVVVEFETGTTIFSYRF